MGFTASRSDTAMDPTTTSTALPDEPGRHALLLASATLDAAERDGRPIVLSQALAGVAHSYRALRAYGSAESYLDKALVCARAAQATDLAVDLLCDLCDTVTCLAGTLPYRAEAHAARERARDHAFEAGRLSGRVADGAWEVKVLLRVSDVLNRLGDHEDASQLQTRALRLLAGTKAANAGEVSGLGRLADS
jgi:tetratricopeptide (TPR) repeat protein